MRVISIGDGLWDLETARRLGYDFVGIGSGDKEAALTQAGAQVFPDFRGLMPDALPSRIANLEARKSTRCSREQRL